MQSRDEYHSIAPKYDLLLSRGLRPIRKNICTFFNHINALNILDICCGTGEQLRLLHNERRTLTGVDLSPAMLARARLTSPPSIRYLETDATNIPFNSGTFDGILISFALHEKNSNQQRAIFNEACRLLSPEGHIVIADYSTPADTFMAYVLGKLLIPVVERAAGTTHYHNYREWMAIGAIKGFLQNEYSGKITRITPHYKGCIQILSLSDIHDTNRG